MNGTNARGSGCDSPRLGAGPPSSGSQRSGVSPGSRRAGQQTKHRFLTPLPVTMLCHSQHSRSHPRLHAFTGDHTPWLFLQLSTVIVTVKPVFLTARVGWSLLPMFRTLLLDNSKSVRWIPKRSCQFVSMHPQEPSSHSYRIVIIESFSSRRERQILFVTRQILIF